MTEVLYEGINTGEKDYSALISKIKQSNADLVYFGGLYTEGGLIVRQMRDQGVKAPLMGGDGITSDEFASVGGPGVEGTLMTYGPDPRNRPDAKDSWRNSGPRNSSRRPIRSTATPACRSSNRRRKRRTRSTPRKSPTKCIPAWHSRPCSAIFAYDKKGDITKLDYVMYIWKKDPSGKITYVECPNSGCTM